MRNYKDVTVHLGDKDLLTLQEVGFERTGKTKRAISIAIRWLCEQWKAGAFTEQSNNTEEK